ncbi:hypothetical protein C9374_005497 [Naegleria lovaniensis]|uniref:CUE domain-containing protein n=1 Tax=Naegleria lovaniensis TaxID=51637 RepID=A0AA88KK57_NAELO|nr:uncharacterized protein C9374_005497 [Naegleria lovaniensis]KAG2382295.1 hypothetical protein C9374_005497 [Naegleria lovaniensis]
MNNKHIQAASHYNFNYGETTTDLPAGDFSLGLFDDFLSSLPDSPLNTGADVSDTNVNHHQHVDLLADPAGTANMLLLENPLIPSTVTAPIQDQGTIHNTSNLIVTRVSLATNNQKYPSGIIQDNVYMFFGSHGASDTYKLEVQVTPIVDQLIQSKQTKLNIQVKRETSGEILKKAKWTLSSENRKEECVYVVSNNNFPKTRRGKGTNEACLFCFELEGYSQIPEQQFSEFRFQFFSKLPVSASSESYTIPSTATQSISQAPQLSNNHGNITNLAQGLNSSNTALPTLSSTSSMMPPPLLIHHKNNMSSLPTDNQSSILLLQPTNGSTTSHTTQHQSSLKLNTPSSSRPIHHDGDYQSSGKKRKKIEIFEPKLHSVNPMYGTVGTTVVLLGQFNVLSEKSVKVLFDSVVVDHPHSITPNCIVCMAPDHEEGNSYVHVVEEFEDFQMRTEPKIFRYISEGFQQGINQLVFNSGPYLSPSSYSPGNTAHTDSSSSSSYSSGQTYSYDSLRQNNLHRAAYNGDIRTVVSLLEDPSCDPLELDNFKRNAFHLACAKGHLSIVQALWNHIVDLLYDDDEEEEVLASTLLYQKDSFGMTALDIATKLLNFSEHPVIFFLKDKMVSYRDLLKRPSFGDLVSVEKEIQEKKMNQLLEFFPTLSENVVLETLERCDWNETDAAAVILCEQFENNIYSKSSMSSKEVFMVIEKQKAVNQIIQFMSVSPFSSGLGLLANRLFNRFKFFNPEEYFSDFENEIKRKCSRKIHKIENCVQPELQLRFSQYINQEENPLIFMTFHGTSEHNINSIKKHGLLVPGKGNDIRPVNGSEYGLGIYLSFSGTASIEYCYGGSKMFVCAVCVRDKIVISEDGSVLVVFDERCVLPCWLITFENRAENVYSPVNLNVNNNLLKQI